MAVVFPVDQRAAGPQGLDQPLVGVLDPLAGQVGDPVGERAVRPDRTEQGHRLRIGVARRHLLVQLVVDLAERRGLMHEPRSAVERDEVACEDLPHVGFLVAVPEGAAAVPVLVAVVVEGRKIAAAEQGFALELLLDLQRLAEFLGQRLAQRRRHHQAAPVSAYLDVVELRPHRYVLVRGQGPGRRCPDQQRCRRLVRQRQRDIHRWILDALVAQTDLACGERGAALRPPPDNLVAAIEQALPEQPGESPPDALHIRLVVRHVGVGQVHPEADPAGHALPFLGVAEHRIHAAPDEAFDAMLLDGFLPVDPEFLLDLDLDGQPVGIPARLARHVMPGHRAVTQENVLEDPSQDMAVVREPVRGRRALVEDERLRSFPQFQALFEDAVLVPEPHDLALGLGKVDDRLGALESAVAHRRAETLLLVSRMAAPEFRRRPPASVPSTRTRLAALVSAARFGSVS